MFRTSIAHCVRLTAFLPGRLFLAPDAPSALFSTYTRPGDLRRCDPRRVAHGGLLPARGRPGERASAYNITTVHLAVIGAQAQGHN